MSSYIRQACICFWGEYSNGSARAPYTEVPLRKLGLCLLDSTSGIMSSYYIFQGLSCILWSTEPIWTLSRAWGLPSKWLKLVRSQSSAHHRSQTFHCVSLPCFGLLDSFSYTFVQLKYLFFDKTVQIWYWGSVAPSRQYLVWRNSYWCTSRNRIYVENIEFLIFYWFFVCQPQPQPLGFFSHSREKN